MGDLAGMSPLYSALGPVMSYIGQQNTNQSNQQMASQANDTNILLANQGDQFNAQQAQASMNFQAQQTQQQEAYQTQMSSTAYQRGTADLKAAGLNPLIASMGSQASSPSGASGGGAQASAVVPSMKPSTDQNPLGAFGSMTNVAKDIASIRNMDAQTKQSTAQSALLGAQATKTMGADTDNEVADTAKKGIETQLLQNQKPESDSMNSVWQFMKNFMSTGAKHLNQQNMDNTHRDDFAPDWNTNTDSINNQTFLGVP